MTPWKKANAEWLYRARLGKGPVRFPEEMIIGYTKTINNQDGTVSWDVPLTRKGLIEPEFISPLKRLGHACSPRHAS